MALLTRPTGFALAAALGVLCVPARADLAAERDLKTAYAYNFIVLSSWPVETGPVLRFCVAGAGELSAFNVLGGKGARERTLSVTNVSTPDRATDCQILYIPPSESKRLNAWLGAVARQATLTISDQADGGAMVNLRRSGSQVVFDVDTRAAAAGRIELSSQLIKLAATRQ